MTKIALPYGREMIDFEYDAADWQLLTPTDGEFAPLSQTDILVEMANPVDGQPLEEIIDPGERIVITVSDSTRITGSERVVPLLVARLVECGVRLADISILFASGIHRKTTETEKRQLITDEIFRAVACYDHEPDNSAELVHIGDTEAGTRVEINRRLLETDHVILTGAIGFHYFAGFTGGRKSILPGLASAASIAQNHLLALDFSNGSAVRRVGVGTGRLDKNPIHQDMIEACAMLAPSYSLNTIINEHQEIVQIFCGDWYTAHRRGCAEYANRHIGEISEKRDLVLASCGGWPKDINLIQAHKALDIACTGLKEGGELIMLAECSEGLGREDLMRWFELGNSAAIAAELREHYQVNGQTAWALASKAERFRITLVSQLPAEIVRRMGLIPATTLAEALASLPGQSNGLLIPHATEVIPVVKR